MIACLLQKLMETGIQHRNLGFEDMGFSQDYREFFVPCLEWLVAEGVVRAGNIRKAMAVTRAAPAPVLTSLGFTLMGRQVRLGEETMTVGQAVKQVSEERRSFSQAGDFVGGLLGGFTKSLSSS
ncbi:MAG: hypothetical protein WD969_00705 [Paracoccaceae bacterium]